MANRFWSAVKSLFSSLAPPPAGEAGRQVREAVFRYYPFAEEAQEYLRRQVRIEVEDPTSTRGGGGWYPAENRVRLRTGQYEAAIHELAHAWWHTRRRGQEDEFIAAVQRLADERDPTYSRAAGLAHGYVYGIPEQNWQGMMPGRMDWEMFAGLASGVMGDIRLLPPYVRRYYEGLFRLLPEDAPEPASLAPHR
mgnify:CR=1 FL=1